MPPGEETASRVEWDEHVPARSGPGSSQQVWSVGFFDEQHRLVARGEVRDQNLT